MQNGDTKKRWDQARAWTGLVTERIELSGGWSGRVSTAWRPGGLAAVEGPIEVSPAAWREALGGLVQGAAGGERRALKLSKGTEVFRVRLELGSASLEAVCKRFESRGRRHTRRNWERALGLQRSGIDTALPLAWLERRRPAREAWMITEAIPGVVDLERMVSGLLLELDPDDARPVKRALSKGVAGLCRALEQAGLFHRDFKASNILVSNWESQPARLRLCLVDLDGIHRRRFYHGDAPWRAIMRLGASVAGCRALTRSDYLRFLRDYLDGGCLKAEGWKRRWRVLARSIEEYNRRSRGRKRGKLDGFSDETMSVANR